MESEGASCSYSIRWRLKRLESDGGLEEWLKDEWSCSRIPTYKSEDGEDDGRSHFEAEAMLRSKDAKYSQMCGFWKDWSQSGVRDSCRDYFYIFLTRQRMMDTKAIPPITPIFSEETSKRASGDSGTSSEDHLEQQSIPLLEFEAMSLQNNADSLVSQRKEEAPKSESIPTDRGGWTGVNSKHDLQKTEQSPAVHQTSDKKKKKKGKVNFVATDSVFFPEIGIDVHGDGKAKTTGSAARKCAAQIVRELHRIKLDSEKKGEGISLSCFDSASRVTNNDGRFGKQQKNRTFLAQKKAVQTKNSKKGGWDKSKSQKTLNWFLKEALPQVVYKTKPAKKASQFNSSLAIHTSKSGKKVTTHATGCKQALDCMKTGNGGWNLQNSQKALNEFTEKAGLPPAVYQTEKAKKRIACPYTSTLSIQHPETGEKVTAEGKGGKIKSAQSKCAMVMARLLYRMGVFEKFNKIEENTNKPDSSKKTVETKQQPLLQLNFKAKTLKNTQDSLVSQKKEETLKSLGGWNRKNSRKALGEYLQKTKQGAEYKIEKVSGRYSSSMSITIPETGRKLSAVGYGSSKDSTKTSCAKDIVQQLYRMKILGKCGAVPFIPNSSEKTATIATGDSMTISEDHFEQQLKPHTEVKNVRVSLEAEELGGWNKENSRKALGDYLQKGINYKAQKIKVRGRFCRSFKISVAVPETGQKILAVGETKTICATAMVHQLYRMKILGECGAKPCILNSEMKRKEIALNDGASKTDAPKCDGHFGEQGEENPTLLAQSDAVQTRTSKEGGCDKKNSRRKQEKGNKNIQYNRIEDSRSPNSSEKTVDMKQESVPLLSVEATSLQNSDDSLVSLENKETPKSVSAGLEVDEFGGWNTKNSKFGLHLYIEKTKQQATYQRISSCSFSITVSVSETGQKLHAVGDTKARCAMEMIHQLYRMKIVGGYGATPATNEPIGSKKTRGTGGWNRWNSRQALDNFLKKRLLLPAVFKTTERKDARFSSCLSIFLPETGKVDAQGIGGSTRKASTNCAVIMVQKLHQLGFLEAFQENVEEKKNGAAESKKTETGGWKENNSKEALEEFLEKTGQSPADFKTEKRINPKKAKSTSYTAILSLVIPGTQEKVTAKGKGPKKSTAESNCTMFMVRLLYQKDALKEFQRNTNKIASQPLRRSQAALGIEG